MQKSAKLILAKGCPPNLPDDVVAQMFPSKFWGYTRCASYKMFNDAQKKIIANDGVRFAESVDEKLGIRTTDKTPVDTLTPVCGDGETRDKGILYDLIARDGVGVMPSPNLLIIHQQTIYSKKSGKVVRVNCIKRTTGPTGTQTFAATVLDVTCTIPRAFIPEPPPGDSDSSCGKPRNPINQKKWPNCPNPIPAQNPNDTADNYCINVDYSQGVQGP